MAEETTSGIAYAKYALSGSNRFVSGIAVLAAIGGFLFGFDTGIIGQALPFIQQDWKPSTFAASWIVASILIGAMVGAAGSGYLAEKISRKWTKCASGCVYVVGAILCAVAPNEGWLIASRFILGLSVGTASFVSPEYISEQTPPKMRGGTVTYNQVMITLGILVAYFVGFGLKGLGDGWRWMLGLGAIPGVALAVAMIFVPHSPRWLASKGRMDDARAVLQRTRKDSSDEEIEQELRDMGDVVKKSREWSLRDLFGKRVRPLMVVGIGLAVFQQFVGINTVIYFTSTILKYTGSSTNMSLQLAVYVGLTNFVTTIVAVLLMDWAGRRKLLLPGTAVLTVALIGLGLFFQLSSLSSHPVIGLICVIVYIVGFAIGLGPVFWLMISEIYPLHFRSQAMAVATIFNWGANFLVSYYFLQMTDAIGKPATFYIYGGMGILSLVFFWFKVPETKNRSLEEIEREIGGAETAEAAVGSGGRDGDRAHPEPYDGVDRDASPARSDLRSGSDG